MKEKALSIALLLISLNSYAQETPAVVKQTEGFNDQKIYYISNTTFTKALIYKKYRLKNLLDAKNYTEIRELLGTPSNIKNEQDIAADGTVLLKRKIATYPGLRLVFPKRNGEYILGRIDFTSENATLRLRSKKLYIGRSIDILTSENDAIPESGLTINIAKTDQPETESTPTVNHFRAEVIRITYDAREVITDISILAYTI